MKKSYVVKDWAGNLMEFGPFACPKGFSNYDHPYVEAACT